MIALIGLSAMEPFIEPLGVCRIDDNGAACWSTTGKPDPELTAQIDGLARETKEELAFVPVRKNRFLIVRCKPVLSTSESTTAGRVRSFVLHSEAGASLVAYRVDSPSSASTSSVTIRMNVPVGKAVDIPFREGGGAKVEDVNITLGRATPSSQWAAMGLSGLSAWHFGVDRTETSPTGDLAFEPIGRDGKTIRYVDGWGRPYDNAKGEAIWQKVAAGQWDWRTPPEANIAGVDHELGSPPLWYVTNVDPKSIAKLRARRLREQTETIGPFVLDPIQPSIP
jgi:hypothetical protein